MWEERASGVENFIARPTTTLTGDLRSGNAGKRAQTTIRRDSHRNRPSRERWRSWPDWNFAEEKIAKLGGRRYTVFVPTAKLRLWIALQSKRLKVNPTFRITTCCAVLVAAATGRSGSLEEWRKPTEPSKSFIAIGSRMPVHSSGSWPACAGLIQFLELMKG